jgi:hypothetical protein
MLGQDTNKSLKRPEHGSVDHDGSWHILAATVGTTVPELETFGQIEVEL